MCARQDDGWWKRERERHRRIGAGTLLRQVAREPRLHLYSCLTRYAIAKSHLFLSLFFSLFLKKILLRSSLGSFIFFLRWWRMRRRWRESAVPSTMAVETATASTKRLQSLQSKKHKRSRGEIRRAECQPCRPYTPCLTDGGRPHYRAKFQSTWRNGRGASLLFKIILLLQNTRRIERERIKWTRDENEVKKIRKE